MTAPVEDLDVLADVANLGDNMAKARYGVAYVRAICSQAHVGFGETSPDEDVLAVDGSIQFAEADVKVQVKCTGQFKIEGRSLSWPVEQVWLDKWRSSQLPVYFILVVLNPNDRMDWITHSRLGSMHRSAAYWLRVDAISDVARINIPKKNRFTAPVLSDWRRDLLSCFRPRVQGLSQ